ncbi:hypothetical protein M378DRAFT_182495 [Amanita muscaria Koide BX008]|uniref:Uncharacterized protein n=1 Tax=Amanita muscaria (strain Koide BX008) TaxID=946122 RepID=A0A0C2WDD0_AMAMK|nr:hypothetical protein M378DRAFT_182495 [Amanita muscaria Koide BX008]
MTCVDELKELSKELWAPVWISQSPRCGALPLTTKRSPKAMVGLLRYSLGTVGAPQLRVGRLIHRLSLFSCSRVSVDCSWVEESDMWDILDRVRWSEGSRMLNKHKVELPTAEAPRWFRVGLQRPHTSSQRLEDVGKPRSVVWAAGCRRNYALVGTEAPGMDLSRPGVIGHRTGAVLLETQARSMGAEDFGWPNGRNLKQQGSLEKE